MFNLKILENLIFGWVLKSQKNIDEEDDLDVIEEEEAKSFVQKKG